MSSLKHTSAYLRPMLVSDLDVVLDIERQAYPIPWSRGVFEDCLENKRNECLVYLVAGQVCGYAIISHVLDETHLLNLCVSPALSGQGKGRALLKELIRIAIERSSTSFFLEVRASNQVAIALYHSEGFNEVGVRPNYYPAENGREDAVLMTLEMSLDQYV